VTDMLRSFGWRDVIDLGDITSARGTEGYVSLWLRVRGGRSRCSTSRWCGDDGLSVPGVARREVEVS
jgi:hypothetical protein